MRVFVWKREGEIGREIKSPTERNIEKTHKRTDKEKHRVREIERERERERA